MLKVNFKEINKVVLGVSLVVAILCIAFIFQALINRLTRPALKKDFNTRITYEKPSMDQPLEVLIPTPSQPKLDAPLAPPSETDQTKPIIDMEQIIETKNIQRAQIKYLRENSREKGGGPDALSEKEIDEMESKGVIIQ